MTAKVMIKAIAIWLAILVLASANGALREAVLNPRLGSAPGLVLSGVLLSCVILATAYAAAPWLGVRSPRLLLLTGLGWLALTLAFEFSFGLARGKPMAEILDAYAFRGGNLWPLVLVITAFAPWLAARLRRWL